MNEHLFKMVCFYTIVSEHLLTNCIIATHIIFMTEKNVSSLMKYYIKKGEFVQNECINLRYFFYYKSITNLNQWTFVDRLSFTLTRFQLFVKICFHLLTNPLKLPETNNLGKIIYYVITTEMETHTGSVKKSSRTSAQIYLYINDYK